MPACSAAWSAPGTCSGARPARSRTSSAIVYQNARVTSRDGGSVSSSRPMTWRVRLSWRS